MNASATAPPELDHIRALGQEMRECVQNADLAAAGELAAERHRRVVALFDHGPEPAADEQVAEQLRELLDADKELLGVLAALRDELARELGQARIGARGVRAYMDAAEEA
ncbi:MAG: flagellar protein FliT [Wenzhouxiangella sp.]|jgi:uroporphyrinogen-III synthase|nr:flagellar protein FliT [Wenzhouxiangella sp.]